MLDLPDQSPRQSVKGYARLYAPTRTQSERCGSNSRLRAELSHLNLLPWIFLVRCRCATARSGPERDQGAWKDEARRIAANIAKLPKLMDRKIEPQAHRPGLFERLLSYR